MAAIIVVIIVMFFGGLAGLAFTFILRPVHEFLELRESIRNRMAKFHTDRASRQEQPSYLSAALSNTLRREQARNLSAAECEFRDLAFQMGRFADTNPLAAWALQKWRLDPRQAAAGLFDLAEAINQESAEELETPQITNAPTRRAG